MLEKELESLGLTRNESIVYLTLLKIGESKTGSILRESGLNSGKIYEILESLKKKGLVSEAVKDGIRRFMAAPPKQIENYIWKKKSDIEHQERIMKQLIPGLERLRSDLLPEKRIVTYTGFRGIMSAAEEALESTPKKSEVISLGVSDVNAWSQRYWVRWEKMRDEKGITARYILSEKGRIYQDLKNVKNIKVKFLELNTPVGIDIYGKDKVLILHYQEPISCTLIYDEHTATTFRSYFEPLWRAAKK